MDKDIELFFDYLLYQKNYSLHTIKSYKEDISMFKEYLDKENISYLDIDYQLIRAYMQELDKKKLSSSSIGRKLSGLRSFYKYLARNKKIKSNPFTLVKSPKKEHKLPKFLYYNELESLFLIPDLSDSFGIRDRLILELLYATGIRVGELELLKIKDINETNKTIKIFGKGSKERIVLFGDYAKEILNLYLKDARPNLEKEKSEYLLLNHLGNRLTARGIRFILDKIIDKSSLDTKISPHVLRHTFATHLLNAGCDIVSVQELLGHESLKATQIYTHITSEGLRNVYLKTHPRSNKKID